MQDIVPPGLMLALAVLALLGLALSRSEVTSPSPAAQPGTAAVYCLLAIYVAIFWCMAYAVVSTVWEAFHG